MRAIPPASLLTLAAAVLLLSACGSADEAKPSGTAQTAAASAGNWPSFDAPPPAAETAAPPPKPCSLVDAAQAEALLQMPVALMNDEPENCLWASTARPDRIAMLSVAVLQEASAEAADGIYTSLTGLPGNLNGQVNERMQIRTQKSGQELDDLGDAAWLSGSNADLVATRQLVVRKGARILHFNVTGMDAASVARGQVSVAGGSAAELGERLQALARAALPKL